MQFELTNSDVKNLKKFMLYHTKSSKRQRDLVKIIIPVQFIIFGYIADKIASFFPIITIVSAIFGILWFIFYPKFFDKKREKILNDESKNLNSPVKINFIFDDKKISYSPNKTPQNGEIFSLKRVSKILSCDENYFIVFIPETSIVLPKTAKNEIEEISKMTNIKISDFIL